MPWMIEVKEEGRPLYEVGVAFLPSYGHDELVNNPAAEHRVLFAALNPLINPKITDWFRSMIELMRSLSL